MTKTAVPSTLQSLLARPRAGYIPTLDGWRAIAIAGVMLFHGGLLFPSHPVLSRIQNLGANGVELFFAISGLLICSRLMEEEQSTGTISLRDFYLRRFFRIQPAALVYLFVVALLAWAGIIAFSFTGWWTAFFSVRNLYLSKNSADGAVYTAHFWSLAVEEHFYLVMPWLLLLLRGRHRVRWFGCLAVITLVVNELISRSSIARMPLNSEFELCWLFLAAWLALLLRVPAVRQQFQRYLQVWPVLVCVCLIGLGVALKVKFAAHLWLPSFPLLIIATMLHPASLIGRFLEWTPLRVVGRISYSLYLWQELFCISLAVFPQAKWPLGWAQHHPQNYILPLGFAFLSYLLVERPFLRIGARFHRHARPTSNHVPSTIGAA